VLGSAAVSGGMRLMLTRVASCCGGKGAAVGGSSGPRDCHNVFRNATDWCFNNSKTETAVLNMSGRGLKRFIRPEEGDTPRTQDYFPSDEPPRSDETSVMDSFGSGAASFHPHFGPGYGHDLHGAESSGAALAPQQRADDANAELMQQLRLDGDQRSRHIQGSVVTCDYSTRMQSEQVQQALRLFDACGADLSKLHFNVYARFDCTTPVGTFWQLAPYQYSHSSNQKQIFLRVPITVFYEDGRDDEVVQFDCKLYTEKLAGADGCKKLVLHFMNVPYDQLDLLNAATRRVVRRMKMRLPAGQRLLYELPKFQGCHSYSLQTQLNRDDLDDLVRHSAML
jgi:hypothetical protein